MKTHLKHTILLALFYLFLTLPITAQVIYTPTVKTFTIGEPKEAQQRIMEYGSNGEFVIVFENGTYYAEGISDEMDNKLKEYLTKDKRVITDIEFTPTGKGWTILAGAKNWTRNVGGNFFDKKNELEKLGIQVVDVEFHPVNWQKEKGFKILTSTGKLMEYDIPDSNKELDFSTVIEQYTPVFQKPTDSQKKNKSTSANYRFSFDWIVVYEVDDGGFGNNKLELYGYGKAIPVVVPKGKVLKDTITTTNIAAKNLFKDEVCAVDKQDAFSLSKNSGKSLKRQGDFIIEVDVEDYGFSSVKEFEEEAELHISFELFENDSTSGDDSFPLAISGLSFSDASIQPKTLNEVRNARYNDLPHLIKLKDGGSLVGISYSFEKIEN